MGHKGLRQRVRYGGALLNPPRLLHCQEGRCGLKELPTHARGLAQSVANCYGGTPAKFVFGMGPVKRRTIISESSVHQCDATCLALSCDCRNLSDQNPPTIRAYRRRGLCIHGYWHGIPRHHSCRCRGGLFVEERAWGHSTRTKRVRFRRQDMPPLKGRSRSSKSCCHHLPQYIELLST